MDEVGEYTLQIMRLAGWYNTWLFSTIEPYLGKEILEVGAGIGNFTALLAEKGKVTATDVNPSYVTDLKSRLRGVNVGFGDVEKGNFFFKNALFDTIICFNVLEHIKNDQKALKNIYSLLKPSGKLVLLVPAHRILYSSFDRNLGHFRRYDKKEVTDMLRTSGFKTVSGKFLNWWAAIGWLIFLKLTGWQKIPSSEVGIFNSLGKIFLWPEKYVAPPFGLSVLAIAQK